MNILGGLSASLLQTLPLIPASLGFYIALRCLKFPDLTVEGSFVFGLVVTAFFIERTGNVFLAFLFSILGGFLFGTVTGLIHIRLKVPSFASGIITSFFGTTLNYYILQKAFKSEEQLQEMDMTNRGIFEHYHTLDNSLINGIGEYWLYSIAAIFILCFIILLIVWLFLNSPFGRMITMYGNNRTTAMIYSNRSIFVLVIGLGFTNALVGLSGCLFAQMNLIVDIGKGSTILIPLLASVVIGEFAVNIFQKKESINYVPKPLLSRRFSLAAAPMLGFLIYNVIVLLFTTVILTNTEFADNYYKYAFIGLIILVIMIIKKNQPGNKSNPDELI